MQTRSEVICSNWISLGSIFISGSSREGGGGGGGGGAENSKKNHHQPIFRTKIDELG